jgi:hypothetical protein
MTVHVIGMAQAKPDFRGRRVYVDALVSTSTSLMLSFTPHAVFHVPTKKRNIGSLTRLRWLLNRMSLVSRLLCTDGSKEVDQIVVSTYRCISA